MMTKMRQMSKTIFVLVAAAFIALIVFEWGADYSGGGPDLTVGEVNGQTLSYTQFNDMYQNMYQNERGRQQGEIDENTLDRLREQVWEQFIQATLLKEQMDKLDIAVTDSEIVYQIMNHPLEEIKQNPSLQTNGIFDMNKYRTALNDPNLPWGQIEQFYRQQIPFQKLQNIITNSVRISESEIHDEYERKNLKAKVEYLAILPARFQSNVKVEETELTTYYENNQDKYQQKEQRDLAYVVFPINPTQADTNRLYDDIATIKERLDLGEEFNILALEFSEDPTVNANKGDLGYFDRQTMVKPFTDAAFAANIGDLIGPIETQFGYHLIKVEDKKTEDGIEKVKASHILLKITAGSSTMFEQEDNAKIFSTEAEEIGWDDAVAENNFEVKTTGFFEEQLAFVPGFERNPAITNFAFISDLGTVSGVFSTNQGYTVFKVNGIKAEGTRAFDEVKNLVENAVKLEKAKDIALNHAQSLSDKVKSPATFREIADSDTSKKVKYDVSPLFNMNQSISGIGRIPEFAATAFILDVGQRSDLISADVGFYYQNLLEKTSFDSTDYNAQKSVIRTRLLNQKKNRVFTDWYNKLKEEADISDNRKKFNIF